jgi:nucleoside-diphosphate-sugar epimerase
MNILIVGGAGDVGQHLSNDFTQQGHAVRILDLAPQTHTIAAHPHMTYFRGNLTDKALVQNAVNGADAIINLAWSFADDPQTIFSTDITGTANLLDAAATSGVRSFIYASTAVVYVVHSIIRSLRIIPVLSRKLENLSMPWVNIPLKSSVCCMTKNGVFQSRSCVFGGLSVKALAVAT